MEPCSGGGAFLDESGVVGLPAGDGGLVGTGAAVEGDGGDVEVGVFECGVGEAKAEFESGSDVFLVDQIVSNDAQKEW